VTLNMAGDLCASSNQKLTLDQGMGNNKHYGSNLQPNDIAHVVRSCIRQRVKILIHNRCMKPTHQRKETTITTAPPHY
jgi:NADP-dependent 3-hydroxy acid dehydrogenase YdfG